MPFFQSFLFLIIICLQFGAYQNKISVVLKANATSNISNFQMDSINDALNYINSSDIDTEIILNRDIIEENEPDKNILILSNATIISGNQEKYVIHLKQNLIFIISHDGCLRIESIQFSIDDSFFGLSFKMDYNTTLILKNISFFFDLNGSHSNSQFIVLASDPNLILFNTLVFTNLKQKNGNLIFVYNSSKSILLEKISVINSSFENSSFFQVLDSEILFSDIKIHGCHFQNNKTQGFILDSLNSTLVIQTFSIFDVKTSNSPLFYFDNSKGNWIMKDIFVSNSSLIQIDQINIFFLKALNGKNLFMENFVYQNVSACQNVHFYFELIEILNMSKFILDSVCSTDIFFFQTNSFIFLSEITMKSIKCDEQTFFFSKGKLINFQNFTISDSLFLSLLAFSNSLIDDNPWIFLKNGKFSKNVAMLLKSKISSVSLVYFDLFSSKIFISSVLIEKNSIIGNYFTDSATIFFKKSNSELIISDCLFISNNASTKAIFIFYYGPLFLLNSSIFSNNFDLSNGFNAASIFLMGSEKFQALNNSFIKNAIRSLFLDNSEKSFSLVFFYSCVFYQNHGSKSAIYFSFKIKFFDFKFIKCKFLENFAFNGAVLESFLSVAGNITIFESCLFENNTAVALGGVFSILNLGNSMLMQNCIFKSNKILGNDSMGGVFYIYGDPMTQINFMNCFFSGNYANLGGAIYLEAGSVNDENSIFENNSAIEAGTFAVNFFSKINLTSSIIINSTANKVGGFMKLMGQCQFAMVFGMVIASTSNKAAVFNVGGRIDIVLRNTSFIRNFATDVTFLACSDNSIIIKIIGCSFIQNFGKGFFVQMNALTIKFKNCYFSQNSMNLFRGEIVDFFFLNNLVANHFCSFSQYACIFNFQSSSVVQVNGSSFQNISFSSDHCFHFIGSELVFKKSNIISADAINNQNNQILLYFYDSIFTLESDIFMNFNSSFLHVYSSVINISYCIFHNISSKGIMYFYDSLGLEISNNNFTFMYDLTGSPIFILNLYPDNDLFYFSFNILMGNSGIVGGALSLQDIKINVSKNFFFENSGNQGGALNILCSKMEFNCRWIICPNVFINNTAKSGGAIKWSNKEPIDLSKNAFRGNTAKYGENFSSQTIKIGVKNQNNLLQFVSFQSGNLIQPLILVLLDYYDQIVLYENFIAEMSLSDEDIDGTTDKRTLLRGSTISTYNQNSFNFSGIALIASPNSQIHILVKTDSIPFFNFFFAENSFGDQFNLSSHKLNPKTQKYEYRISVFLRNCILGEIFDEDLNICHFCPAGSYSLDIKEKTCKKCPPHFECFGGSNLSLVSGFWRLNELSINSYECQMENNCFGNQNGICSKGYEGILCDKCASKYHKFLGRACFECDGSNHKIGFIIFAVFLMGLQMYAIYTIKRNVYSILNKDGDIKTPVFLKIIIDNLQVNSCISNLNIKFLIFIDDFKNSVNSVGNIYSILFPFECLLTDIYPKFNVFFKKIVLGTLIIFQNFVILGFLTLFYFFMRKSTFSYYKLHIKISLSVVLMIWHQSLVNMLFMAMKCTRIENKFYLTHYLNEECWTTTHLLFFYTFILPCLMVWVLILPGIFYFCVRKAIKAKDENAKDSFVYFIKGFRIKYYYWEFIGIIKRFMLTGITCFYDSDNITSLINCLLVISVYSILNLSVRPFQFKEFNTLQDFSNAASFFIYLLVLYLEVEVGNDSKIVIIVLVFVFITMFIIILLKLIYSMNKVYLLSSLGRIRKSFFPKNQKDHPIILPLSKKQKLSFAKGINSKYGLDEIMKCSSKTVKSDCFRQKLEIIKE